MKRIDSFKMIAAACTVARGVGRKVGSVTVGKDGMARAAIDTTLRSGDDSFIGLMALKLAPYIAGVIPPDEETRNEWQGEIKLIQLQAEKDYPKVLALARRVLKDRHKEYVRLAGKLAATFIANLRSTITPKESKQLVSLAVWVEKEINPPRGNRPAVSLRVVADDAPEKKWGVGMRTQDGKLRALSVKDGSKIFARPLSKVGKPFVANSRSHAMQVADKLNTKYLDRAYKHALLPQGYDGTAATK